MFLDRMVGQTRSDLEQRRRELPLEEVKHLAAAQPAPRDLLEAVRAPSAVRLIAEVKRASPSKGVLAAYQRNRRAGRPGESMSAAVSRAMETRMRERYKHLFRRYGMQVHRREMARNMLEPQMP